MSSGPPRLTPRAVPRMPELRGLGGRVRARPVRSGIVAGLVALLLYVLTCHPGAAWQDSGVHQFRIVTELLDNPYGLALSHPLHYWLGRAALHIPLGEPAYRLNLLSALFGAVGVGVLTGVVVALTRRMLAGALAGLTLMLAHSYWQVSTVTETYTLAAALMTIEWCLLLRYARTQQPALLVAVFAVNGLHVADHLLGLLTLVTYVGLALERVLRGQLRPRWLLAAALAWIVGSSPYWTLVVLHGFRTGDWVATLYSTFFGTGPEGRGYKRAVLNTRVTLSVLKNALLAFGYSLPSLAPLVALWGLIRPVRGRDRLFRRVLIAQTLIFAFFVVRYTIPDQQTFFVPVCVLAALWLGLGAARLLRAAGRRGIQGRVAVLLTVNALLPVGVYLGFPRLAEQRGWVLGWRDIPYRDEYRHFLQPWQFGDDSPTRLARDALAQTGPGGWLLADNTTAYPIAYHYRVHGGPENIEILSGGFCVTRPGLPILGVEDVRAHLLATGRALAVPSAEVKKRWGEAFTLDETGMFWRVALRPPATATPTVPPD